MSPNKAESASKIVALGRANKTEAVQIRVDPRRRFVLEMIARRWDRPVSGLLEEVIDEWLNGSQGTILKSAENAWSPFVPDRFVRQAQAFPDTLTDTEAILWTLITGESGLWSEGTKRPRPKASEANFNFELLRDKWEYLCQRALTLKGLQEFHAKTKDQMNTPGAK